MRRLTLFTTAGSNVQAHQRLAGTGHARYKADYFSTASPRLIDKCLYSGGSRLQINGARVITGYGLY